MEILYPAKLGGDCLSPDWRRCKEQAEEDVCCTQVVRSPCPGKRPWTELGTWEGITVGLSLRWLSHISVG